MQIETQTSPLEQQRGGRPRKFSSPEELKVRIDEYFNSCKMPACIRRDIYKFFEAEGGKEGKWKKVENWIMPEPKLPTLTGLALFLDVDRKTLYNYSKKPEFEHVIKMTYTYIESVWEQALVGSKGVSGVIFYLKRHFGWK